tara:strand:+ start:259 stop:1029 length:771 start_codon:yes stop_codon:yes gene_type:complete
MILRRLTTALRKQDWFTVVIETLIVMFGVFLGLQVNNWNTEREARERESVLIAELRSEAVENAAISRAVGNGLLVGAGSARRVLALMETDGPPCIDNCWAVIVDFMHASQWQQTFASWSTYDELRRDGLPHDRRIVEAVEAYQMVNHRASRALETPPEYRTLVRRRIPIQLQDAYWQACYVEDDGFEVYLWPCPTPNGLVVDPQIVADILSGDAIKQSLREWTSIARVLGETLVGPQQETAARLLQAIDGKTGDQR